MDYKRMNRELLKSKHWDEWGDYKTDQKKKIPAPAPQKPVPENAIIVDLPEAREIGLGDISLREAFSMRKSHRKFKDEPLSVEELTFLLWATQGVRSVVIEGERITPAPFLPQDAVIPSRPTWRYTMSRDCSRDSIGTSPWTINCTL